MEMLLVFIALWGREQGIKKALSRRVTAPPRHGRSAARVSRNCHSPAALTLSPKPETGEGAGGTKWKGSMRTRGSECLSWVRCPAVSPGLSDAPRRPSEKLRFSCKARAGASFESAAEARATGGQSRGRASPPGGGRPGRLRAHARQSRKAGSPQFHLRGSERRHRGKSEGQCKQCGAELRGPQV